MGEYITLAEPPHVRDLFVFSQTDFGQGRTFQECWGGRFWEEPQSLCSAVPTALVQLWEPGQRC